MDLETLLKILFIVTVTFTFVALIIPFIIKLAFSIGAIDVPRERHIHTKDMPKLGGLGIFFGFLLGYMLFGQPSTQMISILIGSFIILIVGIVDDITELKASTQFLFQLIAACIVVFYGQILLVDLSAFGFYIHFGILCYPLTILFILGCINCINLIDGLDGLSGGISSIYFLTIAIIALITNKIGGIDIILSLIMLGATLGFLFHNFPPAKIFMGDTGSLFLGFMISVIALLGYKVTTFTSLVVPIVVLAIPIFDTLFAILRRLLKGQSIAEADKEHFHHQLLKMKYSTVASILIIYAIDITFAAVSILYVLGDNQLAIAIYVVLMILLLFIILRTDILFEHKKK